MKRVQRCQFDNDSSLLLFKQCISSNDLAICCDTNKFDQLSDYWKIIFSVFEKIIDQLFFQYFKNCFIFVNSKTEQFFLKAQNIDMINIQSIQAALAINCSLSYLCKLREKSPNLGKLKLTYLRLENTMKEEFNVNTQKILYRGIYNQDYQQDFEQQIQYISICALLLSDSPQSSDKQLFNNSKTYEFHKRFANQLYNNTSQKQSSDTIKKTFEQLIVSAINSIKEFGSQFVVVSYPFDLENEDSQQNEQILENYERVYLSKSMFKQLIYQLQKLTDNRVMLISTSSNHAIDYQVEYKEGRQEIKEILQKNISNKISEAIKILNNEYQNTLDLSDNSFVIPSNSQNQSDTTSQQSNQHLEEENEDLEKVSGPQNTIKNRYQELSEKDSIYFQFTDLDETNHTDEGDSSEKDRSNQDFSKEIQSDFFRPYLTTVVESKIMQIQEKLTLPSENEVKHILLNKTTYLLPQPIQVQEIKQIQHQQQQRFIQYQQQQQTSSQLPQQKAQQVEDQAQKAPLNLMEDKNNLNILQQTYLLSIFKSGSIGKLIQVPSSTQNGVLLKFNFETIQVQFPMIIQSNFSCVRVGENGIEIYYTTSSECNITNKDIIGYDPFSIYQIKLTKDLKIINEISDKLSNIPYNKDKLVERQITCDNDFIYLINGKQILDNDQYIISRECEKFNLKDQAIYQMPQCNLIDQEEPSYLFSTQNNIFYGGIKWKEMNLSISESFQDTLPKILIMQMYDKEKNCWLSIESKIKDEDQYIFAAGKQKNSFYQFIKKKSKKQYEVKLICEVNGSFDQQKIGNINISINPNEFIVTTNNLPEKIIISSQTHQFREIQFLNL